MVERSYSMEWHSAETDDGVRIRYGVAGDGPRTMLLIHGYPETAIAWRKVVGPLTAAGFRVVAPDVRGAGGSSRPASGYDKMTMAADCAVVLEHAGATGRSVVVGHDIGLMVAYAFARQFPDRTDRLVVMDAPLPGTEGFDAVWSAGPLWHFHFHQARDIPEALTAGRERFYLEHHWHALAYNVGAIDDEAKIAYLNAYSAPGAMRAGFELYRAFKTDADDNRAALDKDGKLAIPVLAVSGEASIGVGLMEPMMREVADDVRLVVVPMAGHWIAEENPAALAETLIGFADEGATD